MEKKIMKILDSSKKPLNRNEIAKRVGGYKASRGTFNTALESLLASGSVLSNRGRFSSHRRSGLVEASIVKVTDNYGFAKPSGDETAADLFVAGRNLKGALPGDIVLIKPVVGRRGDLTEGEVSKIITEVNSSFVGVITRELDGKFYLLPDSYAKMLFKISGVQPSDHEVGNKVLGKIVYRGTRHADHKVEIVTNFGDAQSAAVSAEAILVSNNVQREFTQPALEQAKAIGSGVGIHPKEMSVRLDLRSENIFTIDSASTKDIDDAISLKQTRSGWELGVHIADVSYYVTRQSPLDLDAFDRGTSVYFANQVVPMLPPELSNGICSLNPKEDRLAFSALISLSKKGEIKGCSFAKTVINSKIKGVYSEINKLLSPKPTKKLSEKYAEQLDTLKNMHALSLLLHKRRMERGAINLESAESMILFDQDGTIVDIVPRSSGLSENMIEEFMLIANESAASYALDKELPFVYRVHEPPKAEKLDTLFQLFDKLNVKYVRPKDEADAAAVLDDVLREVNGTPLSEVINYSILRSMSKARYTPSNLGHFGLALKNYCHFTSPIRRYPDLAIHRILSASITGMRKDNIEKFFFQWVSDVGTQSTKREINAMTVERSTEDCYKAEFMSRFIGDEYDAVISSATSFGIFVTLPNTVEGLVHIDEFPDGRWYYDGLLSFQNEVGGAQLKVGDAVRVKLVSADIAKGNIDFVIANPEKYVGTPKKILP